MEISADASWSALEQWVHRFDSVSAESHDSRAVNRARQGLEQDLQQLLALKTIIDGRLNALTPIARLPSEILAGIFSFAARAEPIVTTSRDYDRFEPGGYVTSPASERMGWIKVTHVCHYWREVALAHSALWERVSFSIGPEWTEELLARSKGAPIIVDLRGARPSRQYPWKDHLHKHLGHMKALYMDPEFPTGSTGIEFLAIPAPMLEIFDFCYTQYFTPGRRRSPLTVSPPLPLFADHAPRLRSLSLCGWNPTPWSSPLFKSLTYLKIIGDAHGRSSNSGESESFPIFPSIHALVGALRTLEAIETLIIGDCLPLALADIDPSSGYTISLPRLTLLVVDGNLQKCGNLMSILRHADGFKAMFKCTAPNVAVEELKSVLPALTAHLRPSPSIPPSSDRQPTLVIAPSEYGLNFAIWDTEISSADKDYIHSAFLGVERYRSVEAFPPAGLSLSIGSSQQAIPEHAQIAMIGVLSSHIDLHDIQYVYADQSSKWTPEIWAYLSVCCPRTRRIDVLDPSALGTVLQCLRMGINSEAASIGPRQSNKPSNLPPDRSPPASTAVAFPALELLATDLYYRKFIAGIDDVVRGRAEAGYPFEIIEK
ncbi:hypothetical protein FA95DRAFT_1521476 [Auriscalpium vulgare]|uniref:Uncharacterized protein n=1 Tax=Auriscalpium vulgare TaxID=40419 RepID=A0ACB8RNB9_9AGAM|nr:hypothetical protein FA95DRAFT_1521476 [Auriscalpium vulgare]